MAMHEEQQLGEDLRVVNADSVHFVEDSSERPTAEFKKSAARTNREARGEAVLNPTPMPALNEITDINLLTDTYNQRLGELSSVNRRARGSNDGLYKEIAMLQMRLADLMRAQEAKENPKPGPCEVLGYTMDEFMDRFGDMVHEKDLGDLDRVLRFMAPIRNPHLSSKKANQAIFEIISQLTFGDELKEEWTSQPL